MEYVACKFSKGILILPYRQNWRSFYIANHLVNVTWVHCTKWGGNRQRFKNIELKHDETEECFAYYCDRKVPLQLKEMVYLESCKMCDAVWKWL